MHNLCCRKKQKLVYVTVSLTSSPTLWIPPVIRKKPLYVNVDSSKSSDSSDEDVCMLKKLSKEKSVHRKKAAVPAKVGGKCKISEDNDSESSDEEEIVPKKSAVP